MSFNLDELHKVKKATSGMFKKAARAEIGSLLVALEPRVRRAQELPVDERKKELLALTNEYTELRQAALQAGANSHGDARWAAAAAGESWLQSLLMDSSDTIAEVEAVIEDLKLRT